jgi:hypothetical protein
MGSLKIPYPAMSRRLSPALAILIFLLISSIGLQLLTAPSWGHDSYQMTEWLINYAGGFVRRGLPGTLIGMVSGATGIQANHLVIITSLACYLVLGVWLLRRVTTTFPVALVLSCVVLGIPAYQDSIVRKDCLGLLFLLACLGVLHSRLRRFTAMAILNVLAGAAILCHETFVFYALAGLILLNRPNQESPAGFAWVRRGLCLLPAGICFLLTIIHHGTPEHAVAVNESWIPLWETIDPGNPDIGTPDASIAALGWTTGKGLSLSLYMLGTGFYQPMAWLMVFTISFMLVIRFTNRDNDLEGGPAMATRIRVTALLLEQMIFISPLFLLGVDYGRWLFLWLVSSMMFHTYGWRASAWLESIVARVFDFARIPQIIAKVPARDWYLLFFGVPVCWNLHNFLTASPVGRHLDILRSWL